MGNLHGRQSTKGMFVSAIKEGMIGDEAKYITKIDETSSATYIGIAAPGSATSTASWRVQQITTSGTVTSILLADGNKLFDNIWDNRAALSYA